MLNLSGLEAKEPLTDTGKVYLVLITYQAFPSCHCICMQRHRYSNHHIYICPVKKRRHLVSRRMFSIMLQLLNIHVHWKCAKITCMILSLKNPLQTKFMLLRLYDRHFQAATVCIFMQRHGHPKQPVYIFPPEKTDPVSRGECFHLCIYH